MPNMQTWCYEVTLILITDPDFCLAWDPLITKGNFLHLYVELYSSMLQRL